VVVRGVARVWLLARRRTAFTTVLVFISARARVKLLLNLFQFRYQAHLRVETIEIVPATSYLLAQRGRSSMALIVRLWCQASRRGQPTPPLVLMMQGEQVTAAS